jgi:hypothetical protein
MVVEAEPQEVMVMIKLQVAQEVQEGEVTGGKCCNQMQSSAGTNTLGGGGGGGGVQWCGQIICQGAVGGNGRVIVSYPGSAAVATGGTITVSGGIVRHDFQSSGSFVYS